MRTRIESEGISATTSAPTPGSGFGRTQVFTGTFHRRRQGQAVVLTDKEPVPKPVSRRPARLAIMLALAHKIQQAIDSGKVQDRAEVARRLGLTRARVTQIMDLSLLPVSEQESILMMEEVDGKQPATERMFRRQPRLEEPQRAEDLVPTNATR